MHIICEYEVIRARNFRVLKIAHFWPWPLTYVLRITTVRITLPFYILCSNFIHIDSYLWLSQSIKKKNLEASVTLTFDVTKIFQRQKFVDSWKVPSHQISRLSDKNCSGDEVGKFKLEKEVKKQGGYLAKIGIKSSFEIGQLRSRVYALGIDRCDSLWNLVEMGSKIPEIWVIHSPVDSRATSNTFIWLDLKSTLGHCIPLMSWPWLGDTGFLG